MAHIDLQWNLTEIILGEAGGDNAAGFAKDSGAPPVSVDLARKGKYICLP
jgi:hypothetical protein